MTLLPFFHRMAKLLSSYQTLVQLLLSWPKSFLERLHLWNLISGCKHTALHICQDVAESTQTFLYHASIQSSGRQFKEAIEHCISLTSPAMLTINRIWKVKWQLIAQDLHVPCDSVHPSLCSENVELIFWRPVSTESLPRELLRITVGICWHDFITNHEVLRCAAVPLLTELLSKCHLALLDHVAFFKDDVRLHSEIHHHHVSLSSSCHPNPVLEVLLGSAKEKLGRSAPRGYTSCLSLAMCHS